MAQVDNVNINTHTRRRRRWCRWRRWRWWWRRRCCRCWASSSWERYILHKDLFWASL